MAVFLCPLPSGADLGPLYQRIAADLRAGRPLVTTVHVALCDNHQIVCGVRGRGDGDRPARNLYWGGAAGLRAFFDHSRPWKRLHLDGGDGQIVLERVVYARRVTPGPAWRRLGVTRPFTMMLVGLAYRGSTISTATRRFLGQVARDDDAAITLGKHRLFAAGASHIIGYAGHNHLMDVTLADYRWPKLRRRRPVGYFALSCMNAGYLRNRLCVASPARALLLTRTLMYPGAFTIDGLLRGLARVGSQQAVFAEGAQSYARFQKRPQRLIERVFVHDGERRFGRAYGACARSDTER